MLTLALDTSLDACSMALVADGETRLSYVEMIGRGHAERLAVMVRDVMAEHEVTLAQIDRFAVTRGPGAFTGLRIGLAFARGLALALAKPCIGLSTLEVLAAGSGAPKCVAAVSVAGSLFVGAWYGRRVILPPTRSTPDEVWALLKDEDWSVTGPGASALLALRPDAVEIKQAVPDPVILAQLASSLDPALFPPAPLYLRGADAKLPGGILSLDQS